MPSTSLMLRSKGQERKKAIEDMDEILKVFEEGVKGGFDDQQFQFFHGETLGLLDIVVAASCCNYKAFHEACNIEVIALEKTPKFFKWVNALREHPLVNEALPPHDKLVAKMNPTMSPSPKD